MQSVAWRRLGRWTTRSCNRRARRSGLGNAQRLADHKASRGEEEHDAGDVRRLRFIRRAQAAGFTLEEIGELLALDRTGDRARVREMAGERLAALDVRIAELEQSRAALERLRATCAGGTRGPCPILEAFDAT